MTSAAIRVRRSGDAPWLAGTRRRADRFRIFRRGTVEFISEIENRARIAARIHDAALGQRRVQQSANP